MIHEVACGLLNKVLYGTLPQPPPSPLARVLPLYKPYRYVPPQRVGFLRRFGLKTSIDFDHFGLESGLIFKGTTGVYERIYFFQFQMSKKEREICEFEMDFKRSFLFLF